MFPRNRKRALLVVLVLLSVCVVTLPDSARTPAQGGAAQQAHDRLTILLSNDDGFGAPGLRALEEALQSLGEIYVAAPAQNQSGKGHSITTTHDPIFVSEREQPNGVKWYAIEAPPATCVRVALEALLPRRPDLVISGINPGTNFGMEVYLSGTLGAAREAAISRIPAIAVSMRGNKPEDFAATAEYIRELIGQLRSQQLLRPGLFLNVNHPPGEARGVRVARLTVNPGLEAYERRVSPRGRVYFWSKWQPMKDDEEGTDVWAFARGYITLTPMRLDVTDDDATAALRVLDTRAMEPAVK